ncbi:MAG: CHAT domain-containing protein [Methylophilaceae bacterium]
MVFWLVICILVSIITGCATVLPAYIKATEKMYQSPETEVTNQSQKLFHEGKSQEAVEVLRNRIKVSGVNIERQGNLCEMLQQVQDYNDIRDCLVKLASMLKDKNAPKSGSITESVYLKSYHYQQDIVRGYTYIGDYERAIPLAEEYLALQKPGSQDWLMFAYPLVDAYKYTNNQKAFNALVAKADAVNIKSTEEYITWSMFTTQAYVKFDDKASLKQTLLNLDALDIDAITAVKSKASSSDYEKFMLNAEIKAQMKDTQNVLDEYQKTNMHQTIASTKSTIYMSLGDYKNALIYQEISDKYLEKIEANQKKANHVYDQYPYLAKIQQEKTDQLNDIFKLVPPKIQSKKNKIPLLIKLGRVKEAKQLMLETKGYWRTYDQDTEHVLNAQLYESDGQIKEAINEYKIIIGITESKRSSIKRENDKINFGGRNEEYYESIVRLLIKNGQPEIALEYAERGKSRALIDMLSTKSDFGVNPDKSNGTNTKELLDQLREVETEINRSELKGKEESRIKSRSVAADLNEKIRKASPEIYAFVSVSFTASDDIKKLLKPDETLIEFFGGEDELYAFIVTRDKVRAKALKTNIKQKITDFRKSLQDPNSKDTNLKAKSLYADLILPLQLPKSNYLTIVPHASLHYLPFAALNDGKSNLVDRYTLRILPSASVLSLLESRKKPAENNVLILGNPDLGQRSYDLPGAQEEAKEISLLNPKSKLLLRSEASKDAITKLGPQFSYIHIASHGSFDALKPRQSGLLLAVKDGEKDPLSGMLTVDDLYNLNLNADLVTMSACETALGSIQSGDDVIGLSRGFFFAGANSVISSLWQVDDIATEKLMLEFYRQLPLVGKREALRKAQLYVKKSYPHPFYWAAFQLSGK